jgi:hypothetical protein
VILTIAVQLFLLVSFPGYGYQRSKRFAELHVAVSFPVPPQWFVFMADSLLQPRRRLHPLAISYPADTIAPCTPAGVADPKVGDHTPQHARPAQHATRAPGLAKTSDVMFDDGTTIVIALKRP